MSDQDIKRTFVDEAARIARAVAESSTSGAAAEAVGARRRSSEVKPLKPDEIEFLALEGGGGKGFAYLGAIEVLESLQVMQKVRAVSGTSAGAITAFMLSLGMTAEDIQAELNSQDFNEFFDLPLAANGQRMVPRGIGYEARANDECESLVLAGKLLDIEKVHAALAARDSALAWVFGMLAWTLGGPAKRAFEQTTAASLRVFELTVFPVAVLMRHLPQYLAFFYRDMGFFSGYAAREYFDSLIRRFAKEKYDKELPQGQPVSFSMHREIFPKDLLVCGANLSTSKTVLFSAEHTPNFPVADAVRISMGLPLIYKPYYIDRTGDGLPPCGTYVDGGLWNNLPFREIGALQRRELSTDSRQSAASRQPSDENDGVTLTQVARQHKTLGLRLEIDLPKTLATGGDIMGSLVTLGLASGESQVIGDLVPLSIVLDTRGLDLLKFKPDVATQDKVRRRSRRATLRYFGENVPDDDLDERDDRDTAEAKSQTACGGSQIFTRARLRR